MEMFSSQHFAFLGVVMLALVTQLSQQNENCEV